MGLSEADFQANVVQLAQITGWWIHHDRGDYRECIAGDPGFPDLVLARRGRVVFAELKSDTGRLSANQIEWLTRLSGVTGWDRDRVAMRISTPNAESVEFYVWRPADIDRVGQVLRKR